MYSINADGTNTPEMYTRSSRGALGFLTLSLDNLAALHFLITVRQLKSVVTREAWVSRRHGTPRLNSLGLEATF